MKNKKLARTVKKLIYSNRFSLEDISKILDTPIEDCINAFESYYNQTIPTSLVVIGNVKARNSLKENIKNTRPTLLVGPNGSGKDIAIREIANHFDLEIKKSTPLNQADLVLAFGKGPLYNNNNFLYVVDVDSLSKKTYAVLSNYVKKTKCPFILISTSKDNVNSNVSKSCDTINFSVPSPNDIEVFLKDKYGWDGDIKEIYDENIRVVLNRALSGKSIATIKKLEPLDSTTLAMNISCGFAKLEDFDRCKEPLWWTLRWLAYNQRKKFMNNKSKQLINLKKLSNIDAKKFLWKEDYLQSMLLDTLKSPIRTRFSWPPWPKKEEKKEPEIIKMDKPEKKSVEIKQIDFSKWL